MTVSGLTRWLPRARRSIVARALMPVLLLQLTLLGGGTVCPIGTMGPGGMKMAMAGTPATAVPAQRDQHAPCDSPHETPAACTTMAPCAPAAVLPAIAVTAESLPRIAAGVVAPALDTPVSRTTGPEPPPPRA